MRGQSQVSTARLGTVPVRARLAGWIDSQLRKRPTTQRQDAIVMAALAQQRRQALRCSPGPDAKLRRLPY